ncbi:MAG: hypothetical protein NZ932_00115 [Candidatus Bathyarchaeota archaeon]|nr:hypothetical protein [Candidatus Bathyarchaeota archaeon]MDW8040420.1 hypothetical protein [Nitrososphaerota archaeon]
MSKASSESSSTAKISSFALIAIIITLVVAIMALFNAVQAYLMGEVDVATILLIVGFIGVGACTYMLLQMRQRIIRLRIEMPPITTTIECRKCGFKTVREFQRGDYIFKEVEPCQKCNEKMLITAIYREVREKMKATFPF